METLENIESYVHSRLASIMGCTTTDLDPRQSLKDQGMDSYGFMELITELEEKFGFRFSEEELVSKNLDSIHSIASFVDRKVGSRG